jgi:hypothetical protein
METVWKVGWLFISIVCGLRYVERESNCQENRKGTHTLREGEREDGGRVRKWEREHGDILVLGSHVLSHDSSIDH